MKRAALYARVSTKKQDNETQLRALREYADRRGLQTKVEIVRVLHDGESFIPLEYIDVISSGKEHRPSLERLMSDARLKLFDVVIVARFDRFARSTRELLSALEEFQALGIHFISLSESIDTSTPIGKMVFAVLGSVAELERNIIRERVKMGIARARAKGKQLGRPKTIIDREKLQRLRDEGLTLAEIAQKSLVSRRTVRRLTIPPERMGKNPPRLFAHSDTFQTENPALIVVGKNK